MLCFAGLAEVEVEVSLVRRWFASSVLCLAVSVMAMAMTWHGLLARLAHIAINLYMFSVPIDNTAFPFLHTAPVGRRLSTTTHSLKLKRLPTVPTSQSPPQPP